MNPMQNINNYVPKDATLRPVHYYHNLTHDLEFLLANRDTLDLDGDPLKDITWFMADFIDALHHHGCLHTDREVTALQDCPECMDYIFWKLLYLVDTTCEYVVDCRDRKRNKPTKTEWDDSLSEWERDMEFTPDPEEWEGPYRCKDPLNNQQSSNRTQLRRDRVCSPTPSSRSASESLKMSPPPVTPKKRKRKKKQSSPHSTGRRFQQNPPSLIITKIRNPNLFDPDRSHFEKCWNSLCEDAFGLQEKTPPKMLFQNINTIENRRSAITISFHERPKQATLRFFIQRTHKNPWLCVDIFNPNHQHNASPWQQPRPTIKSPWDNNFSPVHNRRPPIPRFSPSSSPFKPQPSPINELHTRRPPPYKFEMPQHSTQRRLANLESKLDELLQILSYVWT